MRSYTILTTVTCMLCAWVCGCTTTPTPSIWPGASSKVWLHYKAEPMASPEEAIGAIKNLQQNFVEWSAGVPLTALDVDAFGLRAKWEWTEVTQQTNYVPSYGGFFAGYNYVPVYSGSYQTQTYSTEKNDMLVIPFDDVKGLALFHMPYLAREFKYGLAVATSQKEIHLRMADADSQLKLANAIYALAAARGADLRNPSVGLQISELTPEQRAALGLPEDAGLLVSSVAEGGPAGQAGIQFLDVLLEINGQSLKTADGIAPIVQAAQQANGQPISVKLLRRQMATQPVTNKAGKVTGEQEVEEKIEHTVEITL